MKKLILFVVFSVMTISLRAQCWLTSLTIVGEDSTSVAIILDDNYNCLCINSDWSYMDAGNNSTVVLLFIDEELNTLDMYLSNDGKNAYLIYDDKKYRKIRRKLLKAQNISLEMINIFGDCLNYKNN